MTNEPTEKRLTVTSGQDFIKALIAAGVISSQCTHFIIEGRLHEPVIVMEKHFGTVEGLESQLVLESVMGLKVVEEPQG